MDYRFSCYLCYWTCVMIKGNVKMKKILSVIECILSFVAIILFFSVEMFTRTQTEKTWRDVVVLAEEKATFVKAIYESDIMKEFVNEDILAPFKIIGAVIMVSLVITALLTLMKCLVPVIKKLEKITENKLTIIFSALAIIFSIIFVVMGAEYDIGLSLGKVDTYYYHCNPELFYYIYIVLLVAIIVCDLTARSKTIAISEEKSKVIISKKTISNAESIKQYKELLDSGAITEEEYEEMKKQILNL